MILPEHRSRVLLVEDDAWIRTFIRDILLDEGYHVIEAADGRTGLRLATEHRPDLVLLDVAMPEFTGVDVLHKLKEAPPTKQVPVIILSAYAAVLPERDAATVAGVITKPIDVHDLIAAVRRVLEPTTAVESCTTGAKPGEQLPDLDRQLELA
jgi:CheY-like chemotaxis protein